MTGPTDPLNQALAHHSAGRLAEAEAVYRRVLQSNPDHPVALHMLVVIAHQGGNHQQAVDLITMALAVKPEYANAHYNLGNALKGLGRVEEAAASFQIAVEQNPESAEAHYSLGNMFQDLARLDEAVDCYRAALAIMPDFADAHLNLGNAQKEMGGLADAVASYQRSLAIKPEYAEAHHNLGIALDHLGRPEPAIASFRAAITLKSDFADAYYNLGRALMASGETQDAIAAFEKFLTLDAGEERIGAELALAHLGVMEPPERTPAEYLKRYYKSRANDWSKAAWDENTERYKGYEIVSRILDFNERGGADLRILDAGCGTGPLAPVLRPHARHLEGVDLSQEMVEQARRQNLYDTLVEDDLEQYLATAGLRFDAIVCAAVLVHFYELDQILSKFWRVLSDDGFLALTIFSDAICEKFSVNASGFFSHNPEYVKAAAADAEFSLVREEHGVHERHGTKEILGAGFFFQE